MREKKRERTIPISRSYNFLVKANNNNQCSVNVRNPNLYMQLKLPVWH